MDNWDDLKYVLAMIRHGTMSAAARYLGSNVATVSRRIERLSQDLDSALFEKRGQQWVATDAALSLARLAEGFDQSLRTTLSDLHADDGAQPVAFEIAAPPAVHTHFIAPRIAEITALHPHLRLNLTDKVYAQGLGEADLQIRLGRPEGGRLRAKKYLDFELAVYHGRDHTPDGRWIGISNKYPDADDLRAIYPDAQPMPTYRVEEMPSVLGLCVASGLPALLPDFLAEEHPRLVRADLPDNGRPFELWIAYHETRHGDATLKAVMDWCCAQAGRPPPRPALQTAAE
ncbi:LysR family transcriptional regulator [Jannaschia sp. Os4]|uniref:LysR family transcriptional regulator n=1 Tax=Jannaschia sp. Os4 TaxID=2807617 RepID=UPI00193A2E91|nr:LysR family transcriptional regulator [Jannaschia sp. Os4]MBM2576444.1 LysR family transcriptional regulator [Jannaschia sp. Os4]